MENTKVKTVFFGSGNFAVKILQGILKMPFLDVVAVVTQPDKPAGRKQELTPCPVMQSIIEQGLQISVYKPEKLRKVASEILEATKPDFILVADYGQMIPAMIIEYPKYKCLNVHGSLLPDLRGAVPAQMAILRGLKTTGVSIPVMTPGLDDGDIVASRSADILADDTAIKLRLRLADIGIELLEEVLPKWFSGDIKALPQDETKATVTWQTDIAKEKAQITATTTAETAERMIRGFNPWPIAWIETTLQGKPKRVKIYQAKLHPEFNFTIGQFVKHEKRLFLGLNGGSLELLEVQMEGKPLQSGKEALFLNSNLIK